MTEQEIINAAKQATHVYAHLRDHDGNSLAMVRVAKTEVVKKAAAFATAGVRVNTDELDTGYLWIG